VLLGLCCIPPVEKIYLGKEPSEERIMKRRQSTSPDASSMVHKEAEDKTLLSSSSSTFSNCNYYSSDEDGVPERAAAFCFGLQQEQAACLEREKVQLPTGQVQKIEQDLLGIADRVDVPESAVQELHHEIQKLVQSGGKGGASTDAFQLAMEIDREYATNRKLSMAFLRSVEGSVKRAAKRYVRHFTVKLDLFGRDKLCKDIELSDLDEYDMEALESGGFQVLREKDRAGRPILFGRYTCMKYRSVSNMVRALWYVWSSIVEDEEHQKSGIIAIGYENGKLPLERFDNAMSLQQAGAMYDLHATSSDGGFDRDLARGILSLPLSLPIRPVGYHICADSSQWQGVSDMVTVTVCKFVRLRLRFHYGTMQETMYKLMTNGIPVDSIPVTVEGEIDLAYHTKWIEHRRRLEMERSQQMIDAHGD